MNSGKAYTLYAPATTLIEFQSTLRYGIRCQQSDRVPKWEVPARTHKVRALERCPPQEVANDNLGIKALTRQMLTIRRRKQPLQYLMMVIKDDCLHAASISSTPRNTAPAVRQARNFDHARDPVSLKYRS